MASGTTYQALKRISWLPHRDANDNGKVIGGQNYDDVLFEGGEANNLTLNACTLVNTPVSASSIIGVVLPANGGTGQSVSSKAKLASSLACSVVRGNIGIIAAGDSITAGSNTFNSGVPQYNVSTDLFGSPIFASGGRFNYVRNAGIPGNTSAQLLARLQTDVIAYAPDVCNVMIGTNDLPSISGTTGYAASMNNIEQIIAQLLDANILPILVTVPPNNTFNVQAKRLRWFIFQLAQFYNIPLIDIYPCLVDPGTVGSYLSGLSNDGVHPNPAGVVACFSTIQAVYENLAQPQCFPYFGAVAETTDTEISNLISNGNFNKQTSSPTPDGWSIDTGNLSYGSGSASLPYNGKTITGTEASPAGAYFLFGPTISASDSGFAVGNTMFISCRLSVSGLTPASATGYSVIASCTNAGANFVFRSVFNTDNTVAANFVVPTATTAIIPQIFVSDAGTYVANNMTIVNATVMNAIWKPGQQGL